MDENTLIALAGAAPPTTPSGRLAGRVCLVTGGGTGIGRASALRFALEGAAAILTGGRRSEEGEAVAAQARAAGAEGVFIATDFGGRVLRVVHRPDGDDVFVVTETWKKGARRR